MQLKIIGLAGPAGSGKDTVGEMLSALCAQHLISCERFSFAGPLKQMLAVAGLPEPASRADKEKLLPGRSYSWRQAAQTLGTEWGRGLDPDFWHRLTEQKLLSSSCAIKYITDVRFANEVDLVHKYGGEVWHIHGRASQLGERAGHASETPAKFVNGIDRRIDNSGAFLRLQVSVAYAFAQAFNSHEGTA